MVRCVRGDREEPTRRGTHPEENDMLTKERLAELKELRHGSADMMVRELIAAYEEMKFHADHQTEKLHGILERIEREVETHRKLLAKTRTWMYHRDMIDLLTGIRDEEDDL
jgi:hypothetical protein